MAGAVAGTGVGARDTTGIDVKCHYLQLEKRQRPYLY